MKVYLRGGSDLSKWIMMQGPRVWSQQVRLASVTLQPIAGSIEVTRDVGAVGGPPTLGESYIEFMVVAPSRALEFPDLLIEMRDAGIPIGNRGSWSD